jgi:hypothetical protein
MTAGGTNVPTTLDNAVYHLTESIRAARMAHLMAARTLGGGAVQAEKEDKCAEEGQKAMGYLLTAGATLDNVPADVTQGAILLHLLDTPDARELLDLLIRVQQVAERIDASRGRTMGEDYQPLPGQPQRSCAAKAGLAGQGESRGVDLAESVSVLWQRVQTEIHGPSGREDLLPGKAELLGKEG